MPSTKEVSFCYALFAKKVVKRSPGEFKLTDDELNRQSKLSEQEIVKARKQVVDLGYIRYTPIGNKTGMYELVDYETHLYKVLGDMA